MKVTFFGTYNTRTAPRIQVMIDGLRERDVTVVECNVPLGLSTAQRVAILHQPWRLPLLLYRLIKCWVLLILKARQFSDTDMVIVGHLGQFDIHLARLLFRRKPIILDYMVSGREAADDRQLNNGWKNKLLVWLDESALKTADTIIVDTEEHLAILPKVYAGKGVVVNVGAPTFWFELAKNPDQEERSKDQPLRIVFFGLYTPLQGTVAIAKALSQLTTPAEVTMIGTGQDLEETKRHVSIKNEQVKVRWIDWVEANKLPEVVAANDVCLGIFGTGAKAISVVPNKVYQGAAVGCVIITSDTHPQRRVLGDAAIFVKAGDDKALANELNALGRNPTRIEALRHSAYRLAQNQFKPAKVVEPLLEILKK